MLWEHGVQGSNPCSPTIKNPMKPKTLYGIIWSLVGLIISPTITILIFGISSWLIDEKLLKGAALWPNSLRLGLSIFSLAVFLAINLFFLLFGVKRGRQIDSAGQNKTNIIITRIIALLLFCVFIFSVFALSREINKYVKEQLREINSVQLKAIDYQILKDGFIVTSKVTGPGEGRYLLEVDLSASGYVKKPLIRKLQPVELVFSKQMFDYFISYEELSAVYFKQLQNYIPAFEKGFLIYELINVDVSLTLLRDGKRFNIGQEKQAVAKVKFNCVKDGCEIDLSVQKPDEKDTLGLR